MAYPTLRTPSSNFATNASSSVVVPAVTGLGINELLIAEVVGLGLANNVLVTAPAGWNIEHQYSPNMNTYLAVFSKVSVLADVGSTFTFSFTLVSTSGIVGAAVTSAAGTNGTPYIDVASYKDFFSTATTAPTGTSITPTRQRTLLMLLPYDNAGSASPNSVSGYQQASNNPTWTEILDVTSISFTGNTRAQLAMAWANQTALGGVATGVPSATFALTVDQYVFGFLAIADGDIIATPISLSTTINVPTLIFKFVVTSINAITNIGTPTISLTALWKNATKNISAWVNQTKS